MQSLTIIILCAVILILTGVTGILIFQVTGHSWEIEDRQRKLDKANQELTIANQKLINANTDFEKLSLPEREWIITDCDRDWSKYSGAWVESDKKRCEELEELLFEYPEEAYLLEEITDPEGFDDVYEEPPEEEEPVCIRWEWYFENRICEEWE